MRSITATMAERTANPRGRGPSSAIAASAQERRGSRAVCNVVKAREDRAEHGASEEAAGGGNAGLKNLKRGRCDDRAQYDHPAQPHGQREDIDVPQREHAVIIMTTHGPASDIPADRD